MTVVIIFCKMLWWWFFECLCGLLSRVIITYVCPDTCSQLRSTVASIYCSAWVTCVWTCVAKPVSEPSSRYLHCASYSLGSISLPFTSHGKQVMPGLFQGAECTKRTINGFRALFQCCVSLSVISFLNPKIKYFRKNNNEGNRRESEKEKCRSVTVRPETRFKPA